MAQNTVSQVAVIGVWSGVQVAHVANFSARSGDPTVTPAATDALGVAYFAAFKSAWQPYCGKDLKVKGYRVAMLGNVYQPAGTPPPPLKIAVEYSGPFVTSTWDGAVNDDSLPSFNAVAVNLRTASGLRRYRANLHLPGLTETDDSGQFIPSVTLAAIQTAITGLMTNPTVVVVGASTWNFYQGVWSRKYQLLNGVGAKAWDYINDVRSATVSPRVGSLTRRKTRANP